MAIQTIGSSSTTRTRVMSSRRGSALFLEWSAKPESCCTPVSFAFKLAIPPAAHCAVAPPTPALVRRTASRRRPAGAFRLGGRIGAPSGSGFRPVDRVCNRAEHGRVAPMRIGLREAFVDDGKQGGGLERLAQTSRGAKAGGEPEELGA